MELLKDRDQVTEIYFPNDGYQWHFIKGSNNVISITAKVDGNNDFWFNVLRKLKNGDIETSLWNGKYKGDLWNIK
jgi:hypothetical protein